MIPISNTNRIIASNYIKSHKNHAKIIINKFLEPFLSNIKLRTKDQIRTHKFLY